uniref:F-box domain-containing protein n=1 Tax=Panagrolaimus sp. ES5 TaxID=591445 RepID=A0AC34F868_9BILA
MNPSDIFKNVEIPVFPFPKTVINYIFANATPKHYKKLNKTCKFIFFKYQRNCVEWIHLQEDYSCDREAQPLPIFRRYKFMTKVERDFALLPSNIWFCSAMELHRASTMLYKTLIPKITRCDIASLTLMRSADLLFDDFKFLTDSGNIQTLELHDTKIIYSNGQPVEFENILFQVNNARFITLNPVHTARSTMKNLQNIQWGICKLMMLRLKHIDNYIHPNQFFNLLQKTSHMSIMKLRDRYIVQFNDPQETQQFNDSLSVMVKEYKEPEIVAVEKKE